MIAIGIDPDTKTTGFGAVQKFNGGLQVLDVRLAKARGRKSLDRRNTMAQEIYRELLLLKDVLPYAPTAITVEWQKLRPRGEKNPNSIVDLCGIAGMCVLAAVAVFGPDVQIFSPIPQEWKGSVPKAIHQNRIRGRLHLNDDLSYKEGYGNGFVPGAKNMPKGQQSHPVDGLGLACWTLDDYGPIYDARIKAEAKARA